MSNMLLVTLREVNNFFESSEESGDFCIRSSKIEMRAKNLLTEQYVAVSGSILNDGIYKIIGKELTANNNGSIGNSLPLRTGVIYELEGELRDETFRGTIYGLRIPRDFLDLVTQIEESVETTPQNNKISEKFFGDYSYSVAMDPKTGLPASWKNVFGSNLHRFRKMWNEVRV